MKKVMKKVLALVMLMLVPAFVIYAESGTNSDDGVITINNAVSGKTYSVYEILELESYNEEAGAFRYKATEKWSSFINSNGIKNEYVTIDEFGYVTWVENKSVEEFASKALNWATSNSITPEDSKTANSTTLEFTGLNLGYYLVDSSLGAICSLNTTKPTIIINEKNTEPTVEKKIVEGNELVDANDVQIGDTVNFKTTITVGAGAQNYVLYDELSEGLTLVSGSVTVVGVDSSYWSKVEDVENGKFEVSFTNDYLATLEKDTEIVVTYSAVLNEKAVVAGDGNLNETYLKYGDNHETIKDSTVTYTYRFDLVKTTAANVVLPGAKFKLCTSVNNNECVNEVKLTFVEKDAEGFNVYRVAVDGDVVVEAIEVGKAKISGLDSTTYYLVETKAPEGYNILTSPVSVVIDGSNLEATIELDGEDEVFDTDGSGIQVINKTGEELPETGGMGTVLFITIGTIMVLCFGVLLVTKLRIAKMNQA